MINVADGDGFGGDGYDLRFSPVAVVICVGGISFLEVAEAFDGESDGEELD